MNYIRLFVCLILSCLCSFAFAVNDAPADADTVTLRTNCYEKSGAVEIANCFTSMDMVDNWLRTVRFAGPNKPTLVDIGPGTFGGWQCHSSNVTLRGSGRDQTTLQVSLTSAGAGIWIQAGCTNLNVQDLRVDGRGMGLWGVGVNNLEAITFWTNVEIFGPLYAWVESLPGFGACPSNNGRHYWFSSRIVATGNTATFTGTSRAYTAACAQSWFFGSQLEANVNSNERNGFAIEAHKAEVHLYGSNARLILASNTTASSFGGSSGTGHYLMAALQGSAIHIHGTGLDVVHNGTGTADVLYADSDSQTHFHANEAAFSIHVTGTGKVQRLAGPGADAGRIEAPYGWGPKTQPPLSTNASGLGTLISRTGADTYVETDCPMTGNCGAPGSGTYPHMMIYSASCTGTAANQGPWFDLVTRSCRQ